MLARQAFEQPHWYAVHTLATKEAYAATNLKRAGFWTYFPHCRVKVRRGIRQLLIEEDRPYFSRYLFVALRFTDEAIGSVNDTFGVARVVCNRFSGIPLRIPNDVMDALIEMTDSEEYEEEFKAEPVPFTAIVGDEVVLDQDDSRSALQGLKGIIASIEGLDRNRRVKVLLQLFGSDHEVDVSAGRIAKIA